MKKTENIWQNKNLVKELQNNGVVVMPTDTIYGILGKALEKKVVEKIYKIRKRNPEKPFIILIGAINELEKFSIILSEKQKQSLEEYWSFDFTQDFQPRAVSIILDCFDKKFEYLHRNTKTLAFRLPELKMLRELLLKTGPLIAPSANTEAKPPSLNITEAKEYFGDLVDLYIDGGKIKGKASKLIRLENNGSITVLRE